MLLLKGAILGVLMPEDEVQLVVISALVGTEHDGVGRLVVELAEVGFGVGAAGQQLYVRAAAILTLLYKSIHF